MKTIRAQYLQGKWHDTETGEIVYMKHGQTYDIIGTNIGFETAPSKPLVPLNSEEKLKDLQSKIKRTSFYLLAKAGEVLHYKLNPPSDHPDQQDKTVTIENHYNCILKEDLYLYLTKAQDWRLCPCICETTTAVMGNTALTIEYPIKGESLNNLFAEMITTFYPHYRSTSGNALKNFTLSQKPDIYNSQNLDAIRSQVNTTFLWLLEENKTKKQNEKLLATIYEMKTRFRGEIKDRWDREELF